MNPGETDVAIIGAGPAGLRAAEVISAAGVRVTVYDRMRSAGRKFLVAGRGGLNLTHSEEVAEFVKRYSGGEDRWPGLIGDFSPSTLREWAASLGVETFVGTSGRVFPMEKQSAKLLRRWITRLKQQGVTFCWRHDFVCLADGIRFETPDGDLSIKPQAAAFALGGGSWPETGSTGGWASAFREHGVKVEALQAANCGFEVAWPEAVREQAAGKPLKNIAVSSGGIAVRGEAMIAQYGIEGGGIYRLGREIRRTGELRLDLKPDLEAARLAEKLACGNLRERARIAWRGDAAVLALLDAFANWNDARALAESAKSLPVRVIKPRPIDEAISSAGGIAWEELDAHLMVKSMPGIFVAGEMIDWEAPTGGYLLQGCFATGDRAGRGMLEWLARRGANGENAE